MIWFQVVDSFEGKPYKRLPVSSVSLDENATVEDLVKAVKLIYSDKLSFDLLVFKTRAVFDKRNIYERDAPLVSFCSLKGLGKQREEAIPVAVDVSQQQLDYLVDNLKRLNVESDMELLEFIQKYDRDSLDVLLMPDLTIDVAPLVLKWAKLKIKDGTRQEIIKNHSIYFIDFINQGHDNALLYSAFNETGVIVAAKVFYKDKKTFERQIQLNELFNHKNLVKFTSSFSTENDERHIIIMPFYAKTATFQFENVPLEMIKIIASGCYDALCYLHSKGYGYGDLKPSHIMLTGGQRGHVVLVDFGCIVPLDKAVIKWTDDYCLDSIFWPDTRVTDWICFASTLADIAGIGLYCSIDLLAHYVEESNVNESLKALILSLLLEPRSPISIKTALMAKLLAE